MITVIAGVNGAGKSSVVGSHFRENGADYFNPDEITRSLMAMNSDLTLDEANGLAWKKGFDYLQDAIANDHDYTFETTLGGRSICSLLHDATKVGVAVRVIFVGLESPEKHIQRVSERVANGGHDIPEDKIRARWFGAINNLMSLIPVCSSVAVFDNSAELVNGRPSPVQLFAMIGDEFTVPLHTHIPDWAKPLAMVAIKRNAGQKI